MNLRQLEYLVAVVDHGTMTAAARHVHTSQPALTRAVRDLEDELRMTLFERSGRNVVLAPGAEPIVAAARKILGEVDKLRDSAARRHQVLRLTASPSAEAMLMARVVPRFLADLPRAEIEVVSSETDADVLRAVVGAQAEIGAVYSRPTDAALHAVSMGFEDTVLISPAGLDLPDPVPLEMLGQVRLVLPPRGSARRAECDRLFAEAGVTPIVALETNERSSWFSAVAAGLGSILGLAAAAELLPASTVRWRRFEPRHQLEVFLVHRRAPSATARAFLDAARDALDAAAR